MAENPVLVKATRSGIPEKLHRGALCIVGENGNVMFGAGDTAMMVYPRSAMKYFQVLPLLESGAAEHFGFTDEEIAVMCASHNAEDIHLGVVRSILHKAGLHESDLGCGAHDPVSKEAHHALVRAGAEPGCIHNNCSGKHAGFLALSLYMGAPLDSYLHPEHPVQRSVRRTVAEMCEVDEDKLYPGIDGCSAPNYAMPLRNLATGFRNLCVPHKDPVRSAAVSRVIRCVSSHSYMIGGKNRYCTEMMEVCEGKVIGKLGADGIYALAFPAQKWGCAIKVEDGALGPQYNVAQAVIQSLNVLPAYRLAPLLRYLETEIRNCNDIRTGFTLASPELIRALQQLTTP